LHPLESAALSRRTPTAAIRKNHRDREVVIRASPLAGRVTEGLGVDGGDSPRPLQTGRLAPAGG
jgi:hypothetical protein